MACRRLCHTDMPRSLPEAVDVSEGRDCQAHMSVWVWYVGKASAAAREKPPGELSCVGWLAPAQAGAAWSVMVSRSLPDLPENTAKQAGRPSRKGCSAARSPALCVSRLPGRIPLRPSCGPSALVSPAMAGGGTDHGDTDIETCPDQSGSKKGQAHQRRRHEPQHEHGPPPPCKDPGQRGQGDGAHHQATDANGHTQVLRGRGRRTGGQIG
jgi:hypothetical protein